MAVMDHLVYHVAEGCAGIVASIKARYPTARFEPAPYRRWPAQSPSGDEQKEFLVTIPDGDEEEYLELLFRERGRAPGSQLFRELCDTNPALILRLADAVGITKRDGEA